MVQCLLLNGQHLSSSLQWLRVHVLPARERNVFPWCMMCISASYAAVNIIPRTTITPSPVCIYNVSSVADIAVGHGLLVIKTLPSTEVTPP
jgi:hypothetical protein